MMLNLRKTIRILIHTDDALLAINPTNPGDLLSVEKTNGARRKE